MQSNTFKQIMNSDIKIRIAVSNIIAVVVETIQTGGKEQVLGKQNGSAV